MPDTTSAPAVRESSVRAEQPGIKYRRYKKQAVSLKEAVVGLFKVTEYMPLIEHHEDCDVEEETDDTTGKVKKTVKTCCKECIFHKDE